MKSIKAVLIALFVVFVFAACEKSNVKPSKGCSHSSNNTTTETEEPPVNGRIKGTVTPEINSGGESSDPEAIVGGGDDDRDGGDKKAKTTGK